MVCMISGFLVSTALLSVSTFLFCLLAVWGTSPREWFRQWWWVAGLAWLAVFAASGLWSTDMATWGVRVQVKLPFLVFPLVVAYGPRLSVNQVRVFTVAFGVILLMGAGYSLSFLIADPTQQLEHYRISGLLPTPCNKDHIRFSLAIAFFVMWGIYIWRLLSVAVKWVVGICMLLLAVYLHILAAKSGLLALYIFIAGWGLYMAFAKRSLVGLAIVLAVPLSLYAAATFLPTFRARLQYIDATIFMMKEGDKTGRFGDIGRLNSYDIAGRIIGQHPWGGVGAGDMLAAMERGYDQWYPLIVNPHARLLPHNQFLVIALGSGLPAAVLFLWWVLVPLGWVRANRKGFFLVMAWLLILMQLLIEPVLEIQNGVFACLFFLYLFRVELPGMEKESNKVPDPVQS